jgi:hypothetical protein
VVVAAVDEGDFNGKMGQAFCGVEAGKAAADDDDAGTAEQGLPERFGQLAHGVRLRL